MKYTVLHVCPTFVPPQRDAGGVANIVRQLSIHQARDDHAEVIIISTDTERGNVISIDLEQSSGSTIRNIVIPQSRFEFAGPFWPVERYLDSIIFQRKGRLVAHIHTCFSSITDLSARHFARHGVPFLFTPHGKTTHTFREKKKYQKLLWLGFCRLRTSIELSGAIGCNSQHEINETKKYLRLTPRVSAFHHPNGFPDVHANSLGPYSDNLIDCLHILFLGYLDPRKNLLNLIRALPLLRSTSNFLLTIAGPDAYGHENQLRSEVQNLNIVSSVRFIGRVDGADKISLMQSAAVLVLPSQGEGQPLVLGEALSVGLPIIYSRQCNFSFAAELGAGIELSSVDPMIIASSIDALWGDKSAYAAMRLSALQVAKHHGWRHASDYWISCYSKLLNI